MSKPRAQPAPLAAAPTLRFANCELRLPTRELWRGGELQPLRRRVFDLFVYLIQRRPATASHAEIARAVWGQADVRSSLIAQAVMQARRAAGDQLDHPTIIVSVHGVGYRFGSTVTNLAPPPATGTDEQRPSDLRDAVEEAENAAARGDVDAAVYLSDQAMTRAERDHARAEHARAMAVATRTALVKGTIQTAAHYAFRSLRLAEAEGEAAVLAKARLAVAQVEIAVGEHQGALKSLDSAHAALQSGGPCEDLRLCEYLYARAYRELRLFEASRQWCKRCQQTVRQLQPDGLALSERNVEVNILLEAAEVAQEDREMGKAQAAFAEALALNEDLRADVAATGDLVKRMCWHGNQGQALLGLDRVDEAWHPTAEAEALLHTWGDKGSPWFLAHLQELHFQWALLMGKSQRVAEALEHLAKGMAAAESTARPASIARLAAVASGICERAGRFEEALRWLRRSVAAQGQVKKDQVAKLAMVSRIRLEADTLRQELQASRLNVLAVEDQNRRLTERLGAYERYGMPDGDGFVGPPGFLAMLGTQHDDAVARDLACCVAVLKLAGRPTGAIEDEVLAASERLKFTGDGIRRALARPLLAVCRWSEGCLVVMLDGMGERRAAAVCADLQQRLSGELAEVFPTPTGGGLQALAINLAAHDRFDAATAALERAMG